jgi:hypothetical protein
VIYVASILEGAFVKLGFTESKIVSSLRVEECELVAAGQVYELLDILTGLASFEGRVLRPTIVSYS